MKDKILFTWLGMTDLRASQGGLKGEELGPIGQAAKESEFAEVHILSDAEESANLAYFEWISGITSAKIAIHECRLSSPMNFSEIYESAVTVIEGITGSRKVDTLKEKGKSQHASSTQEITNSRNHTMVFHISPGTSAMAAIWIILAKTAYPAELIQSSQEGGVQTVSIPFNIAAEFNPALLLGKDDEIMRISQGLPSQAPEFDEIVHNSAAMKDVIMKSRIVAMHNIPVLLYGESGTGKELFARAIHGSSQRKKGAFIEVNCGAIPENLFESEFFGHEKGAFTGADKMKKGFIESADGGTLFLDEIGELPLYAQVKLLRVLQERAVVRVGSTKPIAVDIRIIAATNRNLSAEVADGNFREDLFHRLAIGIINLPPLRERKGDIGLLIDHFLEEINCEFRKVHQELWEDRKLSANARNALLKHSWHGNIRELRNTLSRLILWSSGKIITSRDVSSSLFHEKGNSSSEKSDVIDFSPLLEDGFNLRQHLHSIGLEYINKALEETGGNKSRAAKLLGFANYQTMGNWLDK